jgi:hypothetical protein
VGPLPTRRGGGGGCDEPRRRSSRCGCFAPELGGERALAEGFGLEPVLFLETVSGRGTGDEAHDLRFAVRLLALMQTQRLSQTAHSALGEEWRAVP